MRVVGAAPEPQPAPVHLLTMPGSEVPVIESLFDAVVVAGEDNRILYANRAVERLFGWDPAELVGELITVLVPDRLHSAHLAGFHRYLRTGQPHIIGHPTQVPVRTADGGERQIELLLSTLEQRNGPRLFIATLRDISDRVDLARQTALAHHLLGLLGEEADDETLTARMLAALGESLDMVATALWSPDPDSDDLLCTGFWRRGEHDASALAAASAGMRFRRGVGLPGRVWSSGRPAWVSDVSAEANLPRRAAAVADGVQSAFAFPIAARGRREGVIELFGDRSHEPDPALLATMQVVSPRLGEFVQRVRIEEERRRIARREREIATALQRNLLPPSLPDIAGVDLGAAFHPGGELVVGGDFYDVFPLPVPGSGGPTGDAIGAPAMWGVAIGDVCGTGPEAAAVTAQVRHTARALARRGAGPAEILTDVNAALLDNDNGRFCTCVFALLVPMASGVRLHLANAGHPRPVLREAGGQPAELPFGGPLLGVFDRFSVTEHTLVLSPGEALVLYTDGVTEARAGREQFGEERLHAEVARSAAEPAAAVAVGVERAVRRFAGGDVADDIAVLVVAAATPGIPDADGPERGAILEPRTSPAADAVVRPA